MVWLIHWKLFGLELLMNEQLIYWKHLEFLLSLFMFLFAYAIKFECEATAWETAWKSHIGIASMFSRVN